jgi:hypothetical protein
MWRVVRFRSDVECDSTDRRVLLFLAVVFSVLYGYFYQGGGWNQNCVFDTTRALVEGGTLEITDYADNTGDVSTHEGRIYANKPPGLAFTAVPVYFVLVQLERRLDLDIDAPHVASANAHVLSFWSSGLPAMVLVLGLYWHFRRSGSSRREAFVLAFGFGLGTLGFPYSGALVRHNLVAACLFMAWILIRDREAFLGAGALLGLAALTEYLTIPLVGLTVVYGFWRSRARAPWLLAGPLVAGLVILACNAWAFGGPFQTAYTHMQDFKNEGLLLGMLHWPDLRRLYWLSIHPFRGLLYCCPVFLLAALAAAKPFQTRTVCLDSVFAVAVFGYFLLFNLCFNGWTGGWGVGPRLLIPGLPFLYIFVRPGWARFPAFSGLVASLSSTIMLATATAILILPGPNFGPPPDDDPVRVVIGEVMHGRVSQSRQSILEFSPTRRPTEDDFWDSYNLGEVAGLRGLASLVPLLAVLGLVAIAVWRRPRCLFPIEPRAGPSTVRGNPNPPDPRPQGP